MKTKRSSLVIGCLLLALLAGCAMYPHSGQHALVGIWTNSLGTVWTIKPDGTFSVDLNKDGKPDAWGKYAASGDTITIMEAGGKVPKKCKGKGVYHFTRMEHELHFTLVSDECKLRIKNVLLPWRTK